MLIIIHKLHMHKFHYDFIHLTFTCKYNLIYSDTDTLVYSIVHPDLYERVKSNWDHFDLSASKRPDIQDNTNKKVVGKLRDELNNSIIGEFVTLSPKAYLYEYIGVDGQLVGSRK